jgi:replication factor C subunit 3/5
MSMSFNRITTSNLHLRQLLVSVKRGELTNHSDVGMYDRVVIQDILKEIAQTQQVDLNAKQRFKG